MAFTARSLALEPCWPPLIFLAPSTRSGIQLSTTSFWPLACLLALFAGPSLFSLIDGHGSPTGAPRVVLSESGGAFRRDLCLVRSSSTSSSMIFLRFSQVTFVFPFTRTILQSGRLLLTFTKLLLLSKMLSTDSSLGLFSGSFL